MSEYVYINRDTEADKQAGVDAFDQAYFERFGRYPDDSPLAQQAPADARRRAAIQALVDQGATEGERSAARAALARLDAEPDPEASRFAQDLADEADYEDALVHGEA